MKDWVEWHEAYDDPSSALSARLQLVQAQLAGAIDRVPPGPVRLVSLCAGQGHDVIGVLSGHPRRDDVSAIQPGKCPADRCRRRPVPRHARRPGPGRLVGRRAAVHLLPGQLSSRDG